MPITLNLGPNWSHQEPYSRLLDFYGEESQGGPISHRGSLALIITHAKRHYPHGEENHESRCVQSHYNTKSYFTKYIKIYSKYLAHEDDIHWLVQERHNSSALAMELPLSCTNTSIWPSAVISTSQLSYTYILVGLYGIYPGTCFKIHPLFPGVWFLLET